MPSETDIAANGLLDWILTGSDETAVDAAEPSQKLRRLPTRGPIPAAYRERRAEARRLARALTGDAVAGSGATSARIDEDGRLIPASVSEEDGGRADVGLDGSEAGDRDIGDGGGGGDLDREADGGGIPPNAGRRMDADADPDPDPDRDPDRPFFGGGFMEGPVGDGGARGAGGDGDRSRRLARERDEAEAAGAVARALRRYRRRGVAEADIELIRVPPAGGAARTRPRRAPPPPRGRRRWRWGGRRIRRPRGRRGGCEG